MPDDDRTEQFRCSNCGGTIFLEGPHGGLAVNFACADWNCRARYNDMGPLGIVRDGYVGIREAAAFSGRWTPRSRHIRMDGRIDTAGGEC